MRQTIEAWYKDFFATFYKEQTKILQEVNQNMHFPAVCTLLDVKTLKNFADSRRLVIKHALLKTTGATLSWLKSLYITTSNVYGIR